MSIRENIESKLRAAFSPTHLQITDDSDKHQGHPGVAPGAVSSHVGIAIVSEKFSGMSRIERSRAVHQVIADEIKQIHALTELKTLTPEEYSKLARPA